ncbi:glycosyltransferase family 2 protein [Actinoplanes rectilineatus]|uniref:glycosyltransferase family 2 protein n=1 Tax=Actinoplanes rectilineatus TaxID=113571 RepID=UPI0009FB79D6|nr:glycosyltransferase family 2 protein [Actinoplanes rectilineatus]
MELPPIDPALGLNLVANRTLEKNSGKVGIVIPAHNEAATIAQVIEDCRQGLDLLKADGEILVSASGCTDDTAEIAADAGAHVVVSPAGKGAAIKAGLQATDGDIICLIDGDVQYFGDRPLATILVEPILNGIADATITDLYWRPLYPQMWLHAFFAPLAGLLFPEMLPKCGSTPWSGQRAAVRSLWPKELPDDFTVDLELLMHWNEKALRLRPIVADDWTNPQRPKSDLMPREFALVINHAVRRGRISQNLIPRLQDWFNAAHHMMAEYRPDSDDPQEFEQRLLLDSMTALRTCLLSDTAG